MTNVRLNAKAGLAATASERARVDERNEGDGTRPGGRLDLPGDVEEHVYRIASEALHNAITHAKAEIVTVSVIDDRRALRVEVVDDGAGFDQNVAHPGHFGLSTMAERAETIGATLTITSSPGDGTSIVLCLARDRKQAEAIASAR